MYCINVPNELLLMIINSSQAVEPRYKGLNISIPVVMVTKRSYDLLIHSLNSNSNSNNNSRNKITSNNNNNLKLLFYKSNDINSTIWEHLERLYLGQSTTIHAVSEYQPHYKDWPDRRIILNALKSTFPTLNALDTSATATADNNNNNNNGKSANSDL
jgi:hypothetical protein